MKKISVLLVLCISFICCYAGNGVEYNEGDIVFQISKSSQSKYIALATNCFLTHCGVLIEKDGQLYVLEASNKTKLTPFNDWCDRGLFGMFWTKYCPKQNVKINYSKYLNKPYDLQFKFDNGKYYCSELVYEIYKNELGIELCKPRQIKEYNIWGCKSLMQKRHMNENQYVVAPSDIYYSEKVI